MTGLSKKEKGFVKDYLELGNGTKAALNNYNTENENVAANIASENLRKPKIINAIQEALPDDLLAKVHLQGLDATDEGIPDYAVRHKYLDSAYKLKGLYAPDKSISLNVNADITDPKAKELADKYEEALKENL